MKSSCFKPFIAILILSAGVCLTSCQSGTEDKPFILGEGKKGPETSTSGSPPTGCKIDGDCKDGKVCKDGACVSGPVVTSCKGDGDCKDGKVCKDGKCVAKEGSGGVTCTKDPTICLSTQKCDAGVCTCDPTKTTCGLPAGACAVDFDATLTLKIDSIRNAPGKSPDKFDSPPPCCEYAGEKGGAECPLDTTKGHLDSFLKPPSKSDDLYCCATNSGLDVKDHSDLYCDKINRHDPKPELAVKRWPAHQNKKVKLTFDLSKGCQVSLNTAEFPEFRLENTALDASLIIDAGKGYQTAPPKPASRLNEDEVVGDCKVIKDNPLQIEITKLPLRFMVTVYENFTQCTKVKGLGSKCASEPFKRFYSGEEKPTEADYQIIPGFKDDTLTLGTGSFSKDPIVKEDQTAMSITGKPLQFDPATGKTSLSLVTAFSMPDPDKTLRDDKIGGGQLLVQLGNALLTAEIAGTITKKDGITPIRTKADLTICGGGGGGGEGAKKLELAAASTLAEVCVSGSNIVGGSCRFPEVSKLPFAKDPAAGDPIAGVETRFLREGEIVIENKPGSEPIKMALTADKVGAFRILNFVDLQNTTLAPGGKTSLKVRYEPETNGNGCAVTTGIIECSSSLSLSTSPPISLVMKGQARRPVGELKIEEIEPIGEKAVVSKFDPVDFGETLLGILTRTRLYKVQNTGVRNLVIDTIKVDDSKKNFRIGSVYQGANFGKRNWKVPGPWTVSPNETGDKGNLFFFVNYGPLGRLSGTKPREDTGSLVLAMKDPGSVSIPLKGTAKEDRRATLSLYIQDENRFEVGKKAGKPADTDLLIILKGDKHLYRARNLSFSLRQDDAVREVYLRNDGVTRVDTLLIGEFIPPPKSGGFLFEKDKDLKDGLSLPPGNQIRLGTIQFTPSTTGGRTVSVTSLVFNKAKSVGSDVSPIIGGGGNPDPSGAIRFDLKGVSGAPSGSYDLRVHRLIAGLKEKFSTGLDLPNRLIVSSSTKGIIGRIPGGSSYANEWRDVFTLRNGIDLNPVTGEATLKRIVTEVDSGTVKPPSKVEGLRIFNPGSKPQGNDHYVQCLNSTSPTKECAFFYLYIGDWSGSTTPAGTGDCAGKVAIQSEPKDVATTKAKAIDPRKNLDCMKAGVKDKKGGLYDPATGEIVFEDLAVRLFAPKVPLLTKADNDVDATIRLSLTTGCVGPDKIPDPQVLPTELLVPKKTFDDLDTSLMLVNPLIPYVDQAGTAGCGKGELHGRSLFSGDFPGTLDNEGEFAPGFSGFDLAGVGRNTADDSGNVSSTIMYLVIKAEIGKF